MFIPSSRVVASVFAAVSFMFPLSTLAAPAPFGARSTRDVSTSEGNFYSPPAIFVDGITIPKDQQAAGSTVNGSFHILSMEDAAISDIRYRIDLISALPAAKEKNVVSEDTFSLYNSSISDTIITLNPKEAKNIPFSYTVPAIPGGNYRLRIQLTNSRSKEMGWDDTSLTIAPNSVAYAELLPGAMTIDEYGKQEFSPQSGPNITPEQPFTVRAFAQVLGDTKNSFIPVMTTSSFTEPDKVVETRSLGAILLEPGISIPITIAMNAPATPGVYVTSLVLQNPSTKTPASSVVTYRFVVRGKGANILALRLGSVGTKQGEKVEAEINMVGPADAETTVKAHIAFELLDDAGVAGTLREPDVLTLTDGVLSGSTKVTLDRAFQANPKLRATLTDESGAVLATYTVDIPFQITPTSDDTVPASVVPPTSHKKLVGGIGLLILVLVGIIVHRLRTKRSIGTPVIIAGLMIAGSLLINAPWQAHAAANGITVSTARTGPEFNDTEGNLRPIEGPLVEMFIKDPIHNAPAGKYSRDDVPLEFRITYAVCSNSTAGSLVYADYLKNGGKISSIDAPFGNSWIRPWWSNRLFIKRCPGEDCDQVGSKGYLTTGHYEGRFDFSQLSPSASDTTFRIAALWHYDLGSEKGLANFSAKTEIFSQDLSSKDSTKKVDRNIINLWLNFGQSDLSITKTGPATITTGSNITYGFAVKNNGPATAKNVVITDTIPPSMRLSGKAGGCDTYESTFDSVTCTILEIPAGVTKQAFITLKPKKAPTTCVPSTITNIATVTSDYPDPVANNNSSSVTTSATCPAPVTVTVDLTAVPASIALGSSSTLSWVSSANADTCTASGDWNGSKVPNGSEQTTPSTTGTHTYTITCTNTASGNTATDTANIVVTPAPPVVVPTVDLLVDGSNSITIGNGGSATLTWPSTNATSCWATGDWTGWKTIGASESTGSLTSSKTYTIKCWSDAGVQSNTDSVTVNVTEEPAVDVDLAIDHSTITLGDTAQLSWVSTNATSCSASGNGQNWSGLKNISGSDWPTKPTATGTYTYTLTCINSASGNQNADTVSLKVNPVSNSSGNSGGNGGGSGGFQETR